MLVAGFAALLPLCMTNVSSTASVADPDSGSVYAGLRKMALQTTPSSLRLKLDDRQTTPFGIVMDFGSSKGTATLVAFSTGDASLYFSSGGGIIGGIGRENVKSAAKALVEAASSVLAKMSPATSFPESAEGMTNIFVLTNHGVVDTEAGSDDLASGKSDFSALFNAGQDVITQLRLTQQ